MRISIFGMGYVGAVSSACFAELGHEVVGVDPNPQKLEAIAAGRSPVVEAGVAERIAKAHAEGRVRATQDAAMAVVSTDLSLVCVGTPSNAKGELSLGAVDAVVGEIGRAIAKKDGSHTLVLRSTVVPGTTEDRVAPALERASSRTLGQGLELAFNPEFLREGSAVRDFYAPPFTLAGSASPGGAEQVRRVYEGVEAPFHAVSCRAAESVKFLSNAFHAVKIVFANESGALLKDLGVDSREALELFCEDRSLNISSAYLKPGGAFGGSCLPKEIRAFMALAGDRNVAMPMIENVMASNTRQKERAFEIVAKHGRCRVALFGLAFKPGTDDLRESPYVDLAERLLGKGYEVAIYDEALEVGRLMGANREFIEREIPHLDELLVRDPKRVLEGADVLVVAHAPASVIDLIREHHNGRPIIDLSGVPALRRIEGASYEGLSW
ncbi:MAG: nucleotide sugar dehydrogenase [Planctomycetes bacterium]|nr:nucleotide sugar dehydrogenase [Planctomycetota bacterium]MCB9920002.1 nucleotide sugar dehydrogenase [Planctomycetota bacterium]